MVSDSTSSSRYSTAIFSRVFSATIQKLLFFHQNLQKFISFSIKNFKLTPEKNDKWENLRAKVMIF